MKKISVSDYTLVQLGEDRNVALLFREKTSIAAALDGYGADVIELPAVKKPREDAVIYKTIASSVKNAALSICAGYTEDSIRASWECIKTAKSPVLQISLPVSTVQMEYLYHKKNEKMLLLLAQLCSFASTLCRQVEFQALDAGRADREFLEAACRTALENGASVITLCDSAGTLLPGDLAELVSAVKGKLNCRMFVKCSDALHLGPAAALAAVSAGADGVKASAVGGAELKTSDLSDLMTLKGAELGYETGLDATRIHSDLKKLSGTLQPAGETDFDKPETGNDVFLDSDSTLSDVAAAASALGYDLSDADVGKVHAALHHISEKKGTLGAKELEALIASYAMQAPSTYHLMSYTATCSNITTSMVHLILTRDEENLSGMAVGDGPIDASFLAIEQVVGHHYELDGFQIQAVTEGKEALGQTLVRLRSGGKLYSGVGLSTDIVGASIRAYVNALNKIVAGEQ